MGSIEGEFNYFHQSPPPREGDYTSQIAEYEELKKTLESIPGLITNIDPRDLKCKEQALAFLIEATKQLEPEAWRVRLEELRSRIHLICKENPSVALSEVSWLVSDVVNNLYPKVLAIQAVAEEKLGHKERVKQYRRSLTLDEQRQAFEAILHEQHKPVGFGAVSPDLLPTWYYRL